MADYAVYLKPAAARALKRVIDASMRRRLGRAIEALAAQPRPPGVKALQGEPGVLRLREGDYRILYRVDDKVLTVLVVTIGHRREVYR